MDLGIGELLIVLLIILLLFGVGRISKIARELGSSIRAFREGLENGSEEDETSNPPTDKSATD